MRIFLYNLAEATAAVLKFWGLVILVLMLIYSFLYGIEHFNDPEYPHSGFTPECERGETW